MQNEETGINIHSVQLSNEEILRQISSGVGYLLNRTEHENNAIEMINLC
jgi:hypothetical protein